MLTILSEQAGQQVSNFLKKKNKNKNKNKQTNMLPIEHEAFPCMITPMGTMNKQMNTGNINFGEVMHFYYFLFAASKK